MITKEMIENWMGSDNLDVDTFLDLLCDIANNKYPVALFKQEVLEYADDVFFEEPDTYDEFGVNTKNSFNTPPKEAV